EVRSGPRAPGEEVREGRLGDRWRPREDGPAWLHRRPSADRAAAPQAALRGQELRLRGGRARPRPGGAGARGLDGVAAPDDVADDSPAGGVSPHLWDVITSGRPSDPS